MACATRKATCAGSQYLNEAAEAAKLARPDIDPALFDFLRDLLLLRVPGEQEYELAMRFQQFSGPVMAKGVEDTAFYVYNRLISLNEVGGDPARFGLTPVGLHRYNQERQAKWPWSLSP